MNIKVDGRINSAKSQNQLSVALHWIFISISCTLAVYTAISGYSQHLNNVLALTTLALSVFLCYIYRCNTGLFLTMVFIAYSNYSIAIGVYLFPEIRPAHLYVQFAGTDTFGKGIMCTLIFEIILMLFSSRLVKHPHSIDSSRMIKNYENNILIAYVCLASYALVFFLSFSFGEDGSRGGSSALNEYRVIIMVIGCYYSGRQRIFKTFWTILVLITSFIILLSGNRVDMFGSMVFLIVFWYSDLFTAKRIIILLPLVVVFLAGVGFLRTEFANTSGALSITIDRLFEDKLTYEGAIWGYVPSLSIIELTDVIPSQEKLSLFWKHIVYTFTVGAAGSMNPDLSMYSRDYYLHWWGFISTSYFYFWFRYFGAVLFALLVQLYNGMYQKFSQKNAVVFFDKLKYILSLYFVSNFARWYCYGPMGLVRGMFVCSVAFILFYVIDRIIKRKWVIKI